MGNARLTFEEGMRGSIESRKLADFVVLDEDLLEADAKRIEQMKVLMTVVGGRTFSAGEPPSRRFPRPSIFPADQVLVLLVPALDSVSRITANALSESFWLLIPYSDDTD